MNGASLGPDPAAQAPGQQLPAHPVQLADMAPPEAAQEGPQSGWRLDRDAQGAGRPPSAQGIGVVDTVAAGQGGGHQRHQLIAGVGPPRGAAQVQVLLNQLRQAQTPGQGGGKHQPGIGHQAMVVEGDLDAVGVATW